MKKKVFIFDIDGTICTNTNGTYEAAQPFPNMIKKINDLYVDNEIVMMTARGATTGVDWTDFTRKQLTQWGVKHHRLVMNQKPYGDIYVDDKAINASAFMLLLEKK
tara:strand:- start:15 stop:332 length:318 start_codon:yes stop_codon:yes gene_type:complete